MGDLEKFKEACLALWDAGSYEMLKRAASARLESCPDSPEALFFLAEAQFRSGSEADSGEMLHLLYARVMFLSRVFITLGDAYAKKGEGERAREFYEKFLALGQEPEIAARVRAKMEELDPDGEEGLNQGFRTVTVAELMVRQGHIDTAREILGEILRQDPGNSEAKARLAALTGTAPGPADYLKVIQELEKWRKGLAGKGKTDDA